MISHKGFGRYIRICWDRKGVGRGAFRREGSWNRQSSPLLLVTKPYLFILRIVFFFKMQIYLYFILSTNVSWVFTWAKCGLGVNKICEAPTLVKPVFQTLTSSWNEIKQNVEVGIGESGCWIKWLGKSSLRSDIQAGTEWQKSGLSFKELESDLGYFLVRGWSQRCSPSSCKGTSSANSAYLTPSSGQISESTSQAFFSPKPEAGSSFHDLELLFVQQHPYWYEYVFCLQQGWGPTQSPPLLT